MGTNTTRKIYINLAVRDLPRSKAFFTKLGFSYDPRFTDDNAACMIINEDAYVMFMSEARFQDFTKKQICDTTRQTEGIFCVSADSRAQVEQIVKTAVESGGSPAGDPQDHGFMFVWSFCDPDGHHWEVAYMDPSGLPQ
jgi:uncharacterized protein